jgi:hypothetical protein
MKKYLANTFQEYLESIVHTTVHSKNRMPWWRGHADYSWKLHPSIHHKKMAKNESNMSVQFRNQAKVRHQNVPDINDGPSWVFLMQHYGLPTRILDWTDSPLVALKFGIADASKNDKDAVIWSLMPTVLNENKIGINGIVGTGHGKVRDSFANVWKRLPERKESSEIIAINTQHVDIRQMVQASQFTLHGSEADMTTLPNANDFLCSITIPAASKNHFHQVLNLFHVTESYLFPDLEHLAKQIQKLPYAETDDVKK